MKNHFLILPFSLGLLGLAACDEKSPKESGKNSSISSSKENIDGDEKAAAAKLKRAKDPVLDEIYAFRLKTRQDYNNRRFDELEKIATELRASKSLFDNGAWKIAEFYDSFDCRDDEPESMWQLHDQIHKDWIAAKPESITAHVSYADFLTSYAWHARGTDFADKVTEEGWKLFGERLAAAKKVIEDSRNLPEKDPVWWRAAMTIALGEGLPKSEYDLLITEAKKLEPKFWSYDVSRANSLLPRWYGEPGDWETFADQTSSRPDGLGVETYARIIIALRGYHENIFRESKASWPKTREGLEELRKKYPRSLVYLSESALLATTAFDQKLAKEMFDLLGDTYIHSVWRNQERFVHYKHWAETGKW